ncbi:MAG: endonuclease/exonuclease/phosphatase family protein [Saprospiraceae bacterium]|nr:endonuclease/exonuclease/phosphatase family protein [Saprospiraceae bacterium]
MKIIITAFLFILTVLPFSRNKSWIFRMPLYLSLQVLVISFIYIVYCSITFDHTYEWLFLAMLLYVIIIQLKRILGFALDFRRQVPDYDPLKFSANTFSLISYNVYQHNEKYEEVLSYLKSINSDILLLMEVDDIWAQKIKSLDYPYGVNIPLDNTYGMILLSKFPIIKSEILYRIEEDVPSIVADIKIGDKVVHFLHRTPSPPVPPESDSSIPKELELMHLANSIKSINNDHILVVGDMNDVPWSASSKI